MVVWNRHYRAGLALGILAGTYAGWINDCMNSILFDTSVMLP